jgi:hypothetical protein
MVGGYRRPPFWTMQKNGARFVNNLLFVGYLSLLFESYTCETICCWKCLHKKEQKLTSSILNFQGRNINYYNLTEVKTT